MNTWYVIPARKGSKGLKFKNRRLLPITVNQIPDHEKDNIIVSTDDEALIDFCKEKNILFRDRPRHLSSDEASLKDVILDTVQYFKMDSDDIVVILFPTFPQRTFDDIREALAFLDKNNLKSCTGKRVIEDNHPYLCFEKSGSILGKKVVDHPHYRRQDYPDCFGLCHLVCVAKASEVSRLDDLLVNSETGYMWCRDDLIDVDYEEDFLKYSEKMTSGIERFNPRAFEIEFSPFIRHFDRYFDAIKLLGKTGDRESWLDCACGSGYGTSFLTNFTSNVWGYDRDKEAIMHANCFYKNRFCNFTSSINDLSDKRFDIIFSIETIEHMPIEEAKVFLRQCNDMLVDDGHLLITTPIVEKTNLNPTNEFHFFECSLSDFVSLLADGGFNVVDTLLKETTFTDGETKDQGYFKCQKS